jgi:hypothetical protein
MRGQLQWRVLTAEDSGAVAEQVERPRRTHFRGCAQGVYCSRLRWAIGPQLLHGWRHRLRSIAGLE